MAYCKQQIGNSASLCRKFKGVPVAVYFSDSSAAPEIATVATAKLEATYSALKQGAIGSRIYPIKFKEYEAGEDEQIKFEGQRESIHLRTKAGVDMFKLYNPEDWDKVNLILKNGTISQTMFALFVTDKNFINGIYDATRTKVVFEEVKVTKTRQKATIDAPEMMTFEIESLEPENWVNAVSVEADFDASDLEGLLDLYLTENVDASPSTTVLTVDVTDKATSTGTLKGAVNITDLVTADFLVEDASETSLVVTAAHVGMGIYTLTGTFPTGTTCTVTLNTPTVMGKDYEAINVLDQIIP